MGRPFPLQKRISDVAIDKLYQIGHDLPIISKEWTLFSWGMLIGLLDPGPCFFKIFVRYGFIISFFQSEECHGVEQGGYNQNPDGSDSF